MPNFTGKLALIIDDDSTSIKVLQQLLGQLKVATEAIGDTLHIHPQLAEVSIPDIIFLDLEMPKSNGYTVLEYLQSTPKFDGIPVVAYTTHISHLNDAKNAGFHSFLGKPLDNDLFPSQLERILQNIPVWEVS